MRLRLALLALSLMIQPVAAAAPPSGGDKGDQAGEASEKELARSIDLSGMAVPVFDEDRRLLNYFFVNARLLVAPGKDIWKYREKAHFIRDAVVRSAHRESLQVEGDSSKLDEKRAAERFLQAANEAVGESGAMVNITFTQIASQVGG
ncbi:hypothetical protein GC169_12810 [bacterium]|nr:hypothetical protein [bacterium]